MRTSAQPTQTTADGAAGPSASASIQPPAGGDASPDEVFDQLRTLAKEENRGLFTSLDSCQLGKRRPGHLSLTTSNSFHAKRLNDALPSLEAICSRFFGQPTRVEIAEELGAGGDGGVASAQRSVPQREDERRRRQEALNNPRINAALEVLQAEIVEIRPLGGR